MGRVHLSTMADGKDHLTDIPFQVFKQIMKKLNRKSIAAMRLTCSKLRSRIDTEIGITIPLDESRAFIYTTKYLKFIGSVAVNEACVYELLGKNEGNGMRSYFAKNFDDLFHYPLSLTTITFFGKVHVQFLHDALAKCLNLEAINFVAGFKFEGDLISLLINEDKKKDFKINVNERSTWLPILSESEDIFRQINLKTLKQFRIVFRDRAVTNSDLLNVLLLLKSIRSETLEFTTLHFNIIKGFTETEFFYLSMVVADYFEGHRETLKKAFVGMHIHEKSPNCLPHPSNTRDILSSFDPNHHVQIDPDEIQAEDGYSVDQKLQILRKLQRRLQCIGKVSKLTCLGFEVPFNYHWDFWLAFIENLRGLYTLHLIVSTKYKILKDCAFLKNSSKSLKHFRLNIDITHPFDFSGIEECKELEEIYIFNKPNSSPLLMGPMEAQVKNVKLIPHGLKSLSLGNVVMASEDLNKMLTNQKNLTTLVVMNMGSLNPENGTDCKFLKKAFRIRSLQSCLIHYFRAKTRKTYNRMFQMLDFQMTPEDKAFATSMDRHMGYGQNFLSKVMANHSLDILASEVYCPYVWTRHRLSSGPCSHYSLKFNDNDPHLL